MTVPNFITIARLLSVPLIVWLMIADRFIEATLLFVLAGVSDAADGFIAKRFGAASRLGAYLDPVADKALLVSVFVTLGFKGVLPAWLIVLVVSRDFFIIGGMLLSYVLGSPMQVRPLWISKINTAAQILLIALVLGVRSGVTVFQPFVTTTVLAVAALTIASAAAYLVEWVRHMAGGPGDPKEGRVNLRRQAAFWLGALAALLLFLWIFSSILLPFILGMALAYLLDPVADCLERGGLSRFWATIAILVITVLVCVLLVLVVVPLLVSQLAGFLERLPSYVASLQGLMNQFFQTRIGQYFQTQETGANLNQVVAQGATWVTTLLASVWAGGRALINVVSITVVTPVVAFYLLYDWDRMLARIDDLIPRQHLDAIRAIGHDIDTALAGFIRGQGALCLILGLFYATGLSLVGLNFGFLIGSVAGLISFIPFVGSIVGFVVAVGVALVQFWPSWIWVLVVVGIFAAGQFLEGNILQPRLVGSSIGVHPVWLMFALFAFGALFGFVGVLLAVPATAAIGVLVRFALGRYRNSPIYWGQGGSPPPGGLPG